MKGGVPINKKMLSIVCEILFLVVLAMVLEIPVFLKDLLIGISVGMFILVGSVYYLYKEATGVKRQKGARYGR